MVSETRTADGHSFGTQYGYDSVSGDLVSMTYPDGMILTYQRDSNGQISGILADGQAVVSGVGYLPFGPVKDKTIGGLTVSETFDERYQLSRIQAGTVADYQYVRDAAGNITSQTGSEIPLITTADAGNTPYSYTANRLVSTAGRSYVYDSAGNILSDGIRTFAYNQDNRLIQVKIGSTVVGEYAYDAFGRRVKKVAAGKTTLYHYAGGNLIAETDENGISQRDYIYLNGEPAALRIYGAQFGTMYYFVNDHLGTPQKIVDGTGSVVWAAAYLPFGKAQVKPETVTNNLRFPGQYFDAESGLHYNWNRYYDPDTGRYITADPIGLSGGINLYAYVMENPVNSGDTSGLFSESQKKDIVIAWTTAAGFAVGSVIGFIGGGGSGFLTGPAAVVAAPAGAYAGAINGGVLGAAAGNAIGTGIANMMGGSGGAYSNGDDDGNQRCRKGKLARKKPGKHGQFKGTDALRAENDVVRSAAKDEGLDPKQAKTLHELVSGEGLERHEIVEIAKQVKAGLLY